MLDHPEGTVTHGTCTADSLVMARWAAQLHPAGVGASHPLPLCSIIDFGPPTAIPDCREHLSEPFHFETSLPD